MKKSNLTPPTPGSPRSAQSQENKKGIALITVLAMMSLMTILILTFFSLAQNEYISSTSYSRGLHAQQLAETAVNLVVGQLRAGTTTPAGEKTRAWASQPGAVRAYANAGGFEAGYKLYSAEEMVVSTESGLATDDTLALNGWDANDWEYVDLNEPVIRGEKVYYPIVDPLAADVPSWPQAIDGDRDGIEGFDFDLTTVGGGPMEDAVKDATNGDQETLPLPVKWIYVLEDGSLGTMNASGTFVPYPGSNYPDESNSITGRVAFWADDETSKINVNTAAGGAAWDTPRAGGEIDRNLGRFQPAQREWQRYPGHPATTYLSSVLYPGIANITLESAEMERIFEIVPRVVGGGSLSGTRKVNPSSDEANGLTPDLDRLYPSLDELMYRPGATSQRKLDDTASIETREINEFPAISGQGGNSEDTQDLLERSKFFLTVTSRAPETNLFNRPRVSMWPTYFAQSSTDEVYLTPFDELIRFCAEAGPSISGLSGPFDGLAKYHFQRKNADSTTADWADIERNQELWDYLDRLMGLPIPGYGGSFADKYGVSNQRQLLTQIFDYIRCTNLFDDTVYDYADPGDDNSWQKAYSATNSNDHLTFTNFRNQNERGLQSGHGQVVPIVPDSGNADGTKGFGRFYTIDEVAIQLICNADGRGGQSYGTTGFQSGPQIEGEYSNFPPLESSVVAGNRSTYPAWLAEIYDEGTDVGNKELQDYALREDRWNWQLAWHGNQRSATRSVDPSNKDYFKPNYYNRSEIADSGAMRLKNDETMVQAVMLFKAFTPSSGWTAIQPDFQFRADLTGLEFISEDKGVVKFDWPKDNDYGNQYDALKTTNMLTWASQYHAMNGVWDGRHYGGSGGFRGFMRGSVAWTGFDPRPRMGAYGNEAHKDYNNNWGGGRRAYFDQGFYGEIPNSAHSGTTNEKYLLDETNVYPFITVPFVSKGGQVSMNASSVVTLEIMSHRNGNPSKGSSAYQDRLISAPQSGADLEVVQTLELDFGKFGTAGVVNFPVPTLAGATSELVNEFNAIYSGETLPQSAWSASYDGANPFSASQGRLARSNRPPNQVGRYIRAEDVVWSLVSPHGDQRVIAAKKVVGSDDFEKHPEAGSTTPLAHTFTTAHGREFPGTSGNLLTDAKYASAKRPLPIVGEPTLYQRYGDFDTGQGGTIDGAFINKPDEGNTHSLISRDVEQQPGSWDFSRDYGEFPYFVREWTQEPPGPSYFSPNRIMPGPGMLGSLPTAVIDPDSAMEGLGTQYGAWQTLAFRPQVDGGDYIPHPGNRVEPKDHLIMDLFWMPVVEPYAISEPFSTAGKINMNYQILPFTYVKRATGMYAVFKSEYMQCIPNIWADSYKNGVGRGKGYHWKYSPYGGSLQNVSLRSIIIEEDTLAQFDQKFQDNELFKSATEICEIHLVSDDISERLGFSAGTKTYRPTVAQMENGKFWTDHKLVGDNGREMPYTHIQPRLTTKSNTFKVHYRAQIITKGKGTEPDQWDEIRDVPVAEYRGSTIVERYIEPDDPDIPDYANDTAGTAQDLDAFYKYRVINPTRFAP